METEIKFKLIGHIVFSADAEKAGETVEETIDNANKRLFTRGVPTGEEEASVTQWDVKRDYLNVVIESGRYVRAHDALLRLRKSLSNRLGSKYRLGIRETAVDVYEITIPKGLEESFVSEVVGDLASYKITKEQTVLVFKDLSEKDLQQRVVDRLLKKLLPKVISEVQQEGGGIPYGHVVRRGQEKDIFFDKPVAEMAMKLGWIKRFPGRGQWIYTAPMTKMIKAMRDLIMEEVGERLGFAEWMFPRLLPMDVLKKMPSYIEELPHGMFYVCPPPGEIEPFKEFSREFSLRREVRTDLLKDIVKEPAYVMDAVQCPPFYEFFSGEVVSVKDLPVKVYESMGGWTWRYEAGGVEGLARTYEFFRVEFVYLGTPEQVCEIRDMVADRAVYITDKILDLEWRVVVGAPFYLSPEKAAKQRVDPDLIPTYDIELYLPYRGKREESEWLETTAAGIAKDYYVKNFHIRESSGKEIWTGCTGFGISRLVAGFLAQKGFDIEKWPDTFTSRGAWG
jgi:seryl-tRNA synthetase